MLKTLLNWHYARVWRSFRTFLQLGPPLEPFALLGKEFVTAMVSHVNAICKFPLPLDDALGTFS